MIIIKLQGGLGNQLFQYSFARALSIINRTELYIDFSFYEKKRKYSQKPSIKELNITYKTYNENNYIYRYFQFTRKHNRLLYSPLNKLSKYPIFNLVIPRYVKEDYMNSYENFKNKYLYLYGYWEDYHYFNKYANILRKELTLKKKLNKQNGEYLDIISKNNSVSIHMRGGPYITDPRIKSNYANCDKNYYNNAIKSILNKVKDPLFVVFSNDVDWAKRNFTEKEKHIFIENKGPNYEHLYLMSKCKHNIIINSTYSWWGAWLNTNPNKIIIAPQKWFAPSYGKKDVPYPPKWIRISNNEL